MVLSHGSDGLEKRCLGHVMVFVEHRCSVCITSVYLSFLSVCFSVCLKLTTVNTYHCQRQHEEFYLTSFTLRPITCWPENAPKKEKKKLPISVFPTSMECHIQVFFFHMTTLKTESTQYVAGWVWVGFCLHVCTLMSMVFLINFGVLFFSIGFSFIDPEKKNHCFLQVFAQIIVNIHQTLCV